MFSQTPEAFLHGGPSVPSGYQALSGTFSGAAPQPIEQMLSSGFNGVKTETSNAAQIYMMSGNIPNPQPQGSQLPPGGPIQGNPLLLGGKTHETVRQWEKTGKLSEKGWEPVPDTGSSPANPRLYRPIV